MKLHSTHVSGVCDWSSQRCLRRHRIEDGRRSLRVMDPHFHGPGPGFNPGQPRRTPAIQSLVALRHPGCHQVTIAGSQRPPGAPGGAPQFSMGGPALHAPPGYMAPGSSGPPALPSRMIPVDQPGTPFAAPPRFVGRPVAGPFYPPVAAPMMAPVGAYLRYHSTIYHSLSVFSHLVIMIYGRVTRVFAVTRSRSIKLHSTRFWRMRLVFSAMSS